MEFQPVDLFNRFLVGLLLCSFTAAAQELYPVKLNTALWHGEKRALRYRPDGEDFVTTNGGRRFNRALYGTNTAFRVEAGDLPEFALYMPGMGGNLKLGFVKGNKSIWLIEAKEIIARYTPGKMSYEIRDPLLGNQVFHLVILAMADAEGLILKTWMDGTGKDIELVYAFGGASGRKFSRSGDMGPDPESSFYLHPEDCAGNNYELKEDSFRLKYGKDESALLSGVFPAKLELADAGKLATPLHFYQSKTSATPVVTCNKTIVTGEPQYVAIREGPGVFNYDTLPGIFSAAELSVQKIAGRIKVKTPDPYINTLGAAISIASDAIWEEPSYMHGAVGWRMRLNGWRGPYTADPLGWHDRARMHFEAYAKSQVLSPLTGPVVPDTAFHFARHQEKMGTSMFSSGYISRDPGGNNIRPHHYDMNLVYIDELLWHFNWTGDLKFAKEMWPLLKRHLDWEKRNFDRDDDGLYDAYAAIWASDALYYSGGAVTHSSAYNYRANLMAARIAALIGEPAELYQKEAAKILKAINTSLWIPGEGVYAEYRDGLGLKKVHPSAALWTVYHSIDSDVPDAFQAYQSLRYIDEMIPHIPVEATGLPNGRFYTLSTTNWMPYTWSLNNVVMAESMHTALANWEAGRNEEAFKLFKSELLADMYLGGSPGNFAQISHYDAARGEAYRDFADPVGISSRALVQGLFGILPDALAKNLTIRPGFPRSWDHASITTPDLDFQFKRNGKTDQYTLKSSFAIPLSLKLQVKAHGRSVISVKINGISANWENISSAIGLPVIEINRAALKVNSTSTIEIVWEGQPFKKIKIEPFYATGDLLRLDAGAGVSIKAFNDPQKAFTAVNFKGPIFKARLTGKTGNRTAFMQLSMNGFTWWYPVCFKLKQPISVFAAAQQERDKLLFFVVNNSNGPVKGTVEVNGFKKRVSIPAGAHTELLSPDGSFVKTGTNKISFLATEKKIEKEIIREEERGRSPGRIIGEIINWNINKEAVVQRTVDLTAYFNARVTEIFQNKYMSPRPEGPTLQIPWQGIGDWPHSLAGAEIDDSGLRRLAGKANEIRLPQGIRFKTPGGLAEQNILFSSRWSNYPAEMEIPLSGKAGHAYFLLAGSTNPMQSQFDNGKIIITYTDGSSSVLTLRNPETWWPIQEDYYTDGFAFKLGKPRPVRIHLKTGMIDQGNNYTINSSVDQHTQKKPEQQQIPGGAATVLDLPLDAAKNVKNLRLVCLANDVLIGLMSVTLTQH